MKKFRFLLLLLLVQSGEIFASSKGLIFWSDLMYFKNQEEEYHLKNGSAYSRENSGKLPIKPPVDPPVKPPIPVEPIPDPSTPVAPKPVVEKYIFYNNVFYEGTDLKTGEAPLGGSLVVDMSNKIGMGSEKEGYTIENEDTISLNRLPEIQTLVGMQGSNGGTIINQSSGTINILSYGGVGMNILNEGYAENNGVINAVMPFSNNTVAIQLLGTGSIENASSGNISLLGEYGMLNYGGTVYNWGTINKEKINVQDISLDGKLVMESEGTIYSPGTMLFDTAYIGRSYTGANYTDKGILNLDSSIPENFETVKSNSILYEVIKKDGVYVFERNSFEVLTDDVLGQYLENIYYDSNNKLKDKLFDILTSSESGEQFEWYLDEIFGRGYFPSLIYQTNDAIVFTNETILNQISKKTEATDRESYILGKIKKVGMKIL